MENYATLLIFGALIAWTGYCMWNLGGLHQKRKFMNEKTPESELVYTAGVLDCLHELVVKRRDPMEVLADPEIMGNRAGTTDTRESLAPWRRGVKVLDKEPPEGTIPFRRT